MYALVLVAGALRHSSLHAKKQKERSSLRALSSNKSTFVLSASYSGTELKRCDDGCESAEEEKAVFRHFSCPELRAENRNEYCKCNL